MVAEPLEILIVDDHRLFTAGLAAVIRLLERPVEVRERDNARTALREIEAGLSVDLLIVDIEMPSLNGLDLLTALRRRGLDTRAIVVSATGNADLAERVFAAGAVGFVPKSLPPACILEAIAVVLTGERYVPPGVPTPPPPGDPVVPIDSAPIALGPRQREVLDMLARGLSNKEIADVLDVSVSTVKFHIGTLFRLLGVRTRTECVHVARQRSLMDRT